MAENERQVAESVLEEIDGPECGPAYGGVGGDTL